MKMLTTDELQNCIIGISYIMSEVNLSADDHQKLVDLTDKLQQMLANRTRADVSELQLSDQPGEWDYRAGGFSVEHWNKQ